MRFFVIWAYFASPWFSVTCHKAIRNIRGFRERRGGGVPEKVPCLLPLSNLEGPAKAVVPRLCQAD